MAAQSVPGRWQRHLLRLLAGSPLPAHWFYPPVPATAERQARSGRLHIEIVSHCWQYSRLLAYQLSSLVLNPVTEARITMTVFHAREDVDTCRLLDFIGGHAPANIDWRFRCLPTGQLFRRAIGRNLAALETQADWIWFTDCDLTFQAGCLDHLNQALQGRRDALVYPAVEAKTEVYADSDAVPGQSLEALSLAEPALLELPASVWQQWPVTRATGPLQITHGDVARRVGYCNAVSYYQQPCDHWQKATEDRVFRWLLGTQGTAIDLPGVCRVQHEQKGRYQQGSAQSTWRRRIRRWQHRRRLARR